MIAAKWKERKRREKKKLLPQAKASMNHNGNCNHHEITYYDLTMCPNSIVLSSSLTWFLFFAPYACPVLYKGPFYTSLTLAWT